MSRISSEEEERFLERQKRLNTIHRNMMLKCDGDDSNCTIGPLEECMSYDAWKTRAPDMDGPEALSPQQQQANYEDEMQQAEKEPIASDDVRWAVNVLLEKIAAKFEAHETMDIWRSDAAALVRSFKHQLP